MTTALSNAARRHVAGRAAVALFACTVIIGCQGTIGPRNIDNGGPRNLACENPDIGFQPLRRLSETHLRNTLRDLFGGELGAEVARIAELPAAELKAGFSSEADLNVVNTDAAHAFQDTAEVIAAYLEDQAASAIPELVPCSLSAPYTDAEVDQCIGAFIEGFGLRAYRRPLTNEEEATLQSVYDELRATEPASAAWSSVIEVLIQSPQFLYLVERGAAPVEGRPELLSLGGYELASRLAFFLTGTMPDEALMMAVETGDLATREGVEAQARRLLAKPDAITALAQFHAEWLGMYGFNGLARDDALYPELNDSVRAALEEESRVITQHVMTDLGGTIGDMLSANDYPVSPDLAQVYGTSGPASTGDGFRAGLLTSASFLATHAGFDKSSPVFRGVFIRRNLFCATTGVPLPDADIEGVLGPAANAPTARERLSPLIENPSCAGCHRTFNPLGYALEHYDALGKWRDVENGVAIDSSGSIEDAGDASGPFADTAQFVELIAASETVQHCYSRKVFQSAFGRVPTESDACSIDRLTNTVDEHDGDIRELLVAVTQTDGFLFRRAANE